MTTRCGSGTQTAARLYCTTDPAVAAVTASAASSFYQDTHNNESLSTYQPNQRRNEPPPECFIIYKILYTNYYIYQKAYNGQRCSNLANFSFKSYVNYTIVMLFRLK